MGAITKKRQKEIEQLETDDTKYCPICKKIKPLYEFGIDPNKRKFAKVYCTRCRRDKELQQKYGITPKDYEKLFRQQNGKCIICDTFDPGDRYNVFCVDHDHKTGKIRGLLCNNCNRGLGNFRDNPRTLIAAANYLMKEEK